LPSTEALLLIGERQQELWRHVSRLPEPYRSTILMHFQQGIAPCEIAAQADLAVDSARWRLRRGLELLKESLERDEDGPRLTGMVPLAVASTSPWRLTTVAPAAPGGSVAAGIGALLMMKNIAIAVGLATLLALGWTLLDEPAADDPAHRSDPAALPRVVGETMPHAANARPDARPDARIPLTPNAEPEVSARTTIEVCVRNAATGAPEPCAAVWFVKPGFDYWQLPPEQKDHYSRGTTTFLLAHGTAQVTDANGRTHIPITAASWTVVACKGNLYGSGALRADDPLLEILVAVHPILVVETVDAEDIPVPHVNVVSISTAILPFSPRVALGTTDGDGRIVRVLDPPGAGPREVRLYAELLGGDQGSESVDLNAPPPYPVRITLPPTGTVHARIVDANGGTLDRGILDGLHAELTVNPAVASAKRHYMAVDAEGNATFANVVLGQAVGLRFPPLLDTRMVIAGPDEDEPAVTFVHTMVADHPYLVGTLVGPDDHPVGNARFAIFCRTPSAELLASAGGKTDALGRFTAYLSARCTGQGPVELTLAMDLQGVAYAREARVPLRSPMFGRVELGNVVLPTKK